MSGSGLEDQREEQAQKSKEKGPGKGKQLLLLGPEKQREVGLLLPEHTGV